MTEDLQADFDERGWAIVRGVVSTERALELVRVFDEVMEPYLRQMGASASAADAVWQLPGACRHHEPLLAHLVAGMAEHVGQLLGADAIRLLQDTLILKPAGVGGPIDFHQDYTYTGFLDPPRTVSVRLALTRETVESGCMYVIEGSHAWGLHGQHSRQRERLLAGMFESLPAELQERVERNRVQLELEPGDVSIHHCLTFHGSSPNTSDGPRKTVVAHVFDAACRLVTDRLPTGAEAHFSVDAEGRLTGDGFPILYARDPEPRAQEP